MTDTTTAETKSNRAVISVAVAATISTIFPGFLVGALSVQIISDFGVSEARYGLGLASFFLAATLVSSYAGKVAQDVGPRKQVMTALAVTATTSLLIALFANSFVIFVGLLAVLGASNSANQTAVNLLVSQAQLPRLGLAIALKQSGMPGAALLGGLAVPAIAVTVGWRWVYVLAALLALISIVAVRSVIAPVGRLERAARGTPNTPDSTLKVASVGFACLAFAAGALNAWTVASGVDAGLSEGNAGLLLSAGAACGIAVRLLIGTQLDRRVQEPMRLAALFCAVGAFGVLGLTLGSPATIVPATIVAFGMGWVWPVLTNFAVVSANRGAAAAATGVTQTGVYIGVFGGPLLSGVLIDAFGFPVMWAVVAFILVIGAIITAQISVGEIDR